MGAVIAGAVLGGAASAVVGSALSSGDRKAGRSASRAEADATRQQAAIAGEQWERFKQIYAPLEESLAAEVKTLGGAEDQERAAAEAKSGVAQSFKTANERIARELIEGAGADPSSPFYQHALASSRFAEAGASSGADYQAREQARTMGRQARYALLTAGQGIPSTAMSGLGAASAGFGSQAAAGFGRARQTAQDVGYFAQPFVQAGVNAVQNWWGNRNMRNVVPQGVSFNPAQTGWDSSVIDIGLAKGGIVTKPTVAAIAEEGKPEAVLNPGATAMLGAKKIEKLNQAGLRHMAKQGVSRRAQRAQVSLAALGA